MFFRWAFTVASEMERHEAIVLFDVPRANPNLPGGFEGDLRAREQSYSFTA
jgi:hypothetical protein